MQNVYEKVGHSKFVECKGEGEHFRFLSDWYYCDLFIELFTCRLVVNTSAIEKQTLNYSSFIPLLQSYLRSDKIITAVTSAFDCRCQYRFMLYLHSLAIYSWTFEQIGRHLSSAEDYTNMTCYNLCGINSKHSNISNKGGFTY